MTETHEDEPMYPSRWFIWHEGRTQVHIGDLPEEFLGVVHWRIAHKDASAPSRYTYDAFVAEDELGPGVGPWTVNIDDSGTLLVREDQGNMQTVVIYGPGSWLTARPYLRKRYPAEAE